jgi:transglutaminase-like putative cysteine protease
MLGALLLVLGVVAAPHLLRLPPWLGLGVAAVALWRLRDARRGRPLPPRWARVGLTLAATAAVGVAFGTLAGLEAGVALLVAMGALKLLELRRRRDALVLIYLGYFLVAAQFLFTQAPATAVYLLGGAWALTAMLIAVTRESGKGEPWAHGKLAVQLVAQGLPVMLLLFVFFPRLGGPLWGLPDSGGGATGLSDRLSPGSISRLSQSDAVAFRVTFEGEPPAPDRRYWRGPVFTTYRDGEWRPGRRRQGEPPTRSNRGEAVAYEVMLEPHRRYWLFGLDLPAAAPADGRLTRDLSLRSEDRVRELRRYRLRSFPRYRAQPRLPAAERQRYLALPEGAHPRARELGRKWGEVAGGPEAVVARARRYFRRGGFRYTLEPGKLPPNWVDRFLFESREGFCGHYAGAFAFLMRAAGVPARVVTGYLGAEPNPGSDYHIVRQSDAHAWVEVWLAERGWVRVDPTTEVSPQRASSGLGEAVPADDPVPMMARGDGGWLADLRLRLDAAEMAWNRWVLAYGPGLQRQFLGRFGLGEWPRMVAAMAGGLGLVGLLVAAVVLGRRSRTDPAAAAFARLEGKLARAGVVRRPGEGPRDFTERAAAELPRAGEAIRAAGGEYLRLRYGPGGDPRQAARLRRKVRRLRPGRA